MTTNLAKVVFAIASQLIEYSPDNLEITESNILKAVCAARESFIRYGIQLHISSQACVEAREALRERYLYGRRN